jgi:hypothetical protein
MEKFRRILYREDLTPGYSTILGSVRYFVEHRQDPFPEGAAEVSQEGWKGFWNWIKKNL